jgi:hypothetical protein
MNEAFMAGHANRKLLIGSCYRSPAYQVVVFINWLINGYHGDIAKTIRHASPPNYSQHTIASKAAIDFVNVDGSPSGDHPEDFKDTVEYAWLRRYGGEFSFYESWPEGNEFGMRAEPWHWQYRSWQKLSAQLPGDQQKCGSERGKIPRKPCPAGEPCITISGGRETPQFKRGEADVASVSTAGYQRVIGCRQTRQAASPAARLGLGGGRQRDRPRGVCGD